jgi:hypothetical protein
LEVRWEKRKHDVEVVGVEFNAYEEDCYNVKYRVLGNTGEDALVTMKFFLLDPQIPLK